MTEQAEKSRVDLNKLKAGGFIKERGKDLFSVRLRVPGGRMAVFRLKKIVEVAEKYGGEFVHLSVRQSIELVHVDFKHISDVAEELGDVQQKVASCGARVRVPVACGGCEYNPRGLMDTQKSALEVDAKLFGIETGHHKFKVGFAGCPSDCPKSATTMSVSRGPSCPPSRRRPASAADCASSRARSALSSPGRMESRYSRRSGASIAATASRSARVKRGRPKRGDIRCGSAASGGEIPWSERSSRRFLPEEKVVEFISSVLAWYRANAEGLGRIRLGDIIIRKGPEGLLDDLKRRFPEHAVDSTIPPQVIDIQIGKRS